MRPVIEVSYDKVIIEGVEIERPSRIGVSQWLEFFEDLNPGNYWTGYAHGMNSVKRSK